MTEPKNYYLSGLALLGFGGIAYSLYQNLQKNKHPKVIEQGEVLSI